MPFRYNTHGGTLTIDEMRQVMLDASQYLGNLDPNARDYEDDAVSAMTVIDHLQPALIGAEHAEGRSYFPATGVVAGPIAATARVDGGGRYGNAAEYADVWAEQVANRLLPPEARALTVGSIDIPALVPSQVIGLPTGVNRITDLLVNREETQSNEVEWLEQTTRTSNATVVADSALKPTSVFTVTPRVARMRVVAHLSEPVPQRLLQDYRYIRSWLYSDMFEGFLASIETQAISGTAAGEQMQGILTHSGRTQVAFSVDVPTTLRKTRTALQLKNERPNAWAMHTNYLEALDLITAPSATGPYLFGDAADLVFGKLPIIPTTSVTQGWAILADWTQARLYLRTQVSLDVDVSGTNFTNNTVVMRAEMRAYVAYLRPQAFAVADLTV
jgi:HK97 family phage major capsid protein